jgi:hypothetical protein
MSKHIKMFAAILVGCLLSAAVVWAYPPSTWACPQDGDQASLESADVVFQQSCKTTAYNARNSHRHFENGKYITHTFVVQWCD